MTNLERSRKPSNKTCFPKHWTILTPACCQVPSLAFREEQPEITTIWVNSRGIVVINNYDQRRIYPFNTSQPGKKQHSSKRIGSLGVTLIFPCKKRVTCQSKTLQVHILTRHLTKSPICVSWHLPSRSTFLGGELPRLGGL